MHQTAPNEGAAIGLAIGYYAASKKIPAVYMQNSGIGNAMNPLISLADTKIMSVPMLLIIGWRGELTEEGKQLPDEPQHIKQGQTTLSILDLLDVPYEIVHAETDLKRLVNDLIHKCINKHAPLRWL